MSVNTLLNLEIDAKALLGEGPCWDKAEKLLYWVDIPRKKVHVYNSYNKQDHTIDVGKYVSCVVVRESGGLVVAMENGLHFLDPKTTKITPIVDPESHLPENRFNDGKCDPAGRLWAGTMAFDESANKGSLYLLDTDLNIKKVKEKVTISNGLAWSPDMKTMYYVDSPTKQVVAFDYDNHLGQVCNERVIITIPDGEGIPDGITSDREGKLWIAHWGGSKVSRWDPSTGRLIDYITVPASQVTSCVFGGENMDELYITTARTGLSNDALQKEPHAGGVFRLKTNVEGMPSYKFKG